MSWQATAYVKGLLVSPTGATITRSEKLVLFVLADSIDPHTGWAWPSMDLIAKECLFGERQIRRIIRLLETKGILETQQSSGRSSNKYRFIAISQPGKNVRVEPGHDVRVNNDTTRTFPASNPDILTPQPGHSYVPQVVEPKAVDIPPSNPDEDAEQLEPMQLAFRVIEECGIPGPPGNPGILSAVAGAIEVLIGHEKKSKPAAVEFLIAHVKDAQERGDKVNRFWFSDCSWRVNGKSQGNSNGDKAGARSTSNRGTATGAFHSERGGKQFERPPDHTFV